MSKQVTDINDVLEFPCRFPIKVMGESQPDFQLIMFEVVRVHAPDLAQTDITTRDSSSGKYVSLTITVTATSREHLDNIYRSLTSHVLVKWVL
ncbi:YbeD family protein [Vogesella sp. LIG4]|uniref:HP0495 family protein n=1 Tax=Vogesella sp. LIG4 TaxID=1192162 RepID=UPI00081FC764|nr:DUF493 domain-containing protein [Vogesella sp. LIG4]SCK26496.1 hypothetical protein PSELUDRAFT_3192 [Vogesella sp. LIG4]